MFISNWDKIFLQVKIKRDDISSVAYFIYDQSMNQLITEWFLEKRIDDYYFAEWQNNDLDLRYLVNFLVTFTDWETYEFDSQILFLEDLQISCKSESTTWIMVEAN